MMKIAIWLSIDAVKINHKLSGLNSRNGLKLRDWQAVSLSGSFPERIHVFPLSTVLRLFTILSSWSLPATHCISLYLSSMVTSSFSTFKALCYYLGPTEENSG